jgi:hypothetical protein
MNVHELLKVYDSVRRLYLYNKVSLELTPEEITQILNRDIPTLKVKPADVLAALAYGTLCEDRFAFDIKIKYLSPRSRKSPAATFTFAGRPVTATQVKKLSKFEKRYGEINFKWMEDESNEPQDS